MLHICPHCSKGASEKSLPLPRQEHASSTTMASSRAARPEHFFGIAASAILVQEMGNFRRQAPMQSGANRLCFQARLAAVGELTHEQLASTASVGGSAGPAAPGGGFVRVNRVQSVGAQVGSRLWQPCGGRTAPPRGCESTPAQSHHSLRWAQMVPVQIDGTWQLGQPLRRRRRMPTATTMCVPMYHHRCHHQRLNHMSYKQKVISGNHQIRTIRKVL